MAHHVTSADIPVDGEHLKSAKVSAIKNIAGLVSLLGFAFSVYLLFFASEKTRGIYSYSWVFGLFFFCTLAIGGCFWTLLHNVSNSGWGTSVRRIFENLGSVFPWMFLFAIPLLIPGEKTIQKYLYEWMNIHRGAHGDVKEYLHHHDHLLYVKFWFMNIPFWYGRILALFILLGGTIIGLRKLSTGQDTDPEPTTRRLFRARFHSTYPLIFFALTITFFGFDWLMGMDYTWFSTMWGVYLFAGAALNSMAVIVITAALLKRAGYLKHVCGPEHFHIMGKLLLAFTIFWAYIAFDQFFLIWYADVTEETKYFLIRNTEGWNVGSWCLMVFHFVVPFVLLLQAWLKKNPKTLAIVSVYTLVMHVLDHYIITIPERGISLGNINHAVFGDITPTIPGAFWGDILAFVTVGAGFLFFYLRALGQHALYPHRDPRILESANVSN